MLESVAALRTRGVRENRRIPALYDASVNCALVCQTTLYKVSKHAHFAWLAEVVAFQPAPICSPRAATKGAETERQMYTNYSNGEVYGSRFFNWAVIVGAAALVIVSFNSLAPQQTTQATAAPAKTVAVSAEKHPG